MTTRNALSSVLTNFLGTYVSRHSDYNGYWLFGYLVPTSVMVSINLLQRNLDDETSPLAAACQSAVTKFHDQLVKAGLAPGDVSTASLTVRCLPDPITGEVNGHCSVGYHVNFTVDPTTQGGKQYQACRRVFVAPHNPNHERRGMRAT